jgi:hypothetical protein
MSIESKLQNFSSEMDVSFPTSFIEFFKKRKKSRYYSILDIDDFVGMNYITADLPSCALPFLSQDSGDLTCLFFHENLSSPAILVFLLDQARSVIQTQKLDDFFGNPNVYSVDHPKNEDGIFVDEVTWSPLLYDFKSPDLSSEILKPHRFNSTLDFELDRRVFSEFIELWHLRYPSIEACKSDLERIIFECLPNDPNTFSTRDWWLQISKSLKGAGLFREAMFALENCESVHNVYPSCGHVPSLKEDRRWLDLAEVLKIELEFDVDSTGVLRNQTLKRKNFAVVNNLRF